MSGTEETGGPVKRDRAIRECVNFRQEDISSALESPRLKNAAFFF